MFFLASPVHADYQRAYQDYVYNYGAYRNSYNEYTVAKSTYQTYRTLTAQNEAINKFRAVLKNRATVMVVYYDLLQEKLNSAPGVVDSDKSTFNGIKESEKNWLAGHQKKIDAAGSLEDLNSVSQEFDSRYSQMDLETRQTVGKILLSKEVDLKGQLDLIFNNLDTKLKEMRTEGVNTTTQDRGVISSKNKLELFNQKVDEGKAIFFPERNDQIDIFKGQQRLTEANQYLRETVNYLLEVIKSVTG